MSLMLNPNDDENNIWELMTFSDSDWGGDKDYSKSIRGWEIFPQGCLIGCGSRGQKIVSLSSTETEYMSASELMKQIINIKQVLAFMEIKINIPITIRVDNVGEIWLCENINGKNSRHIDIKYHHIRDHVKNGVVEIRFVKTKEMYQISSPIMLMNKFKMIV